MRLGLICVTVLVVGCGSSGSGAPKPTPTPEPTQAAAAAPEPNEPLAAAAKRMEHVIAHPSCRGFARLVLHSVLRGPDVKAGTPPTADECRNLMTGTRRGLTYVPGAVHEYGPAGFTESRDALDLIWVLDTDGSWKAVSKGHYRAQSGAQLAGADATASAFIDAVRAKDCRAMWSLLNLGSRFVSSTQGHLQPFCKSMDTTFRDEGGGFSDIAADPSAEPERLALLRDFGLYGVPLANGRYLVMIVSDQHAGIADSEGRTHAKASVLELLSSRLPA
jgi:hypothetical protein